mgnify:CR=1 FL=1
MNIEYLKYIINNKNHIKNVNIEHKSGAFSNALALSQA